MIHCFYFRKWVRELEVELLPQTRARKPNRRFPN